MGPIFGCPCLFMQLPVIIGRSLRSARFTNHVVLLCSARKDSLSGKRRDTHFPLFHWVLVQNPMLEAICLYIAVGELRTSVGLVARNLLPYKFGRVQICTTTLGASSPRGG
jgi:hypothetical protein